MSDKGKKNSSQGKALETFIVGLGKIGWFILRISWHGLRRTRFKTVDRILSLAVTYGALFVLVYWNWKHLEILSFISPRVFNENTLRFLVFHIPQYVHFFVLAGVFTIVLGVILGFTNFFKMLRYQKELKHIGLKSATGLEPQVVEIQSIGDFKTKITLASQGVGLEQYKSKKSDLEATFGAIVEDICISAKSRKLVEIHLVSKELRTMVSYGECVTALIEPYSFVVGQSLGGVLTQSIRSLPHLLIAGTSGNGKSVFFNQSLISLMKSSPHIQMYLLDLKLGVEVKAYNELPNVRIAKDETEAVHLLRAVAKEMKSRFQLLEKNGNKQIDPERDGKDLILVGVDEASVLYGKRRGNREGNNMTNIARDLTDEIAKLGRAACVHLIIATQKVTTETIDTKVQENVGGRICFRVSTLQGSNTVLGNKKAYELPAVKGRAIWACGNEFTEVQTPFISEPQIDKELKQIKADFDIGQRKCLQGMLTPLDVTNPENETNNFFPEHST